MARGKGRIPNEYRRFEIIKEMGWDYHTYINQPRFFIDEINEFLSIEAKYNKYVYKQQERKLNKK